jgi:bifunctional UDP-N-acetylglucosamine pyrophosphorylase/glucosamine-1-phosphate N-acetyltransferase
MADLRSIILAAGKGTRMKSALPKVLHKVCGKPIIDYVLDVVRGSGSGQICVVVGHESDRVREHLNNYGSSGGSGSELRVVEQKLLLGTADAVKTAAVTLKGYKGDVLVLCGDTPLITKKTVAGLIRKHRAAKAVCTILTANVDDPFGYGRIVRDHNGRVLCIREEKDASEAERSISEINVGMYCFKAPMLIEMLGRIQKNARKQEFYLTDIIELFGKANLKVETSVTEAVEGLGVNSRQDLAVCEEILRWRILDDLMSNGVTIVDPATTFIWSGVKIGQDTVIRPMTFIENDVRIGRDCVIGPFCRVRPGTKIDDNVEVGNFAEISRSSLGKGCRMKHLSFLGDSTVGAGSNIGAGMVTANYDGKAKNKTFIGPSAFIGSNSTIVAPVKIGRRSVLGAGSVLTAGHNIPDQKVAYGVPARLK